jgi:pimeloyl-ACP methyl ester carboxylesterase
MVISYALAADHPDRVARLVVGEARCRASRPRPPLFLPGPAVPPLFHLAFNRLDGLNEQLVRGREERLLQLIFDAEATIKLPAYAVEYYADGFASSRAALRGSFGFYRAGTRPPRRTASACDQADDARPGHRRRDVLHKRPPNSSMKAVANDVQGLVIPGAGHFLAEEAPAQLLAALTDFLAPYRDGAPARQDANAVGGSS